MSTWRKALVALLTVALLTVGTGIIIWVSVARDRILPQPATLPAPDGTNTVMPVTEVTEASPNAASVLGLVREYSPGALIIVVTPLEGSAEQIIVGEGTEIWRGDGTRVGNEAIAPGLTIYAEGEMDAIGRLVAQTITLVDIEANTPTALPPSPTPKPTSSSDDLAPLGMWHAEYYDNATLSGTPVLVRTDKDIDFQWQLGSPAPGLPKDEFSVRWRGRWDFQAGGYRFYAYSDDGVRLWVDGVLVIDQWRDQSATVASGDVYLTEGEHLVEVAYYDRAHNAQIRVWWDYRGLYPDWKGEYFGNPDLVGDPVLVRNDLALDFDWGARSPDPAVPEDWFSARWTRNVVFEEGGYRFLANVDDGVRVWVDGRLIIDEWHSYAPRTYVGYTYLGDGSHTIRVEFLEQTGNAFIRLWWERIDTFSGWKGEYFDNAELRGDPAFVRDDVAISFDWGTGSPGYGLPSDNFSARWTRSLLLDGGEYVFWAKADDGVRVYLDGTLLIDDWRDSSARLIQEQVTLKQGKHSVVIEYYERGGEALVQVGWALAPTPTPSATTTPSPTRTVTTSPTATPTVTRTPTQTTSPTQTATWTPSPSLSPTATESPTPTLTPTETVSSSGEEVGRAVDSGSISSRVVGR